MSDAIRIGGLPIVIARGPAWFVLPADGTQRTAPLGGPFSSPNAARWFVVEYLETQLTEPQRELWRRIMERHTPTTDAGLELGLIDMVQHGRSYEKIAPYIPRRQIDRRAASAGDRDAA